MPTLWLTLWNASRAPGISDHMIWMRSKLYEGQSGEVRGKWESNRNFPILSGVRQGCVLSPRLFSAVLQWAMKTWGRDASLKGFNLGPTTLSKYFSLVAIDTWWSVKIQRLAKNALDAYCTHQHNAIWSFVPSVYHF